MSGTILGLVSILFVLSICGFIYGSDVPTQIAEHNKLCRQWLRQAASFADKYLEDTVIELEGVEFIARSQLYYTPGHPISPDMPQPMNDVAEYFSRQQADVFSLARIAQGAAIGLPPEEHWMLCGQERTIRAKLFLKLTRSKKIEPSPWLSAGATPVLLSIGEVDEAVNCYRQLAEHPKLQHWVLTWCREGYFTVPKYHNLPATEAFFKQLEIDLEPSVPQLRPTEELSQEQRWILSVSALPSHFRDPRVSLKPTVSIPVARKILELRSGVDKELSVEQVIRLHLEMMAEGERAKGKRKFQAITGMDEITSLDPRGYGQTIETIRMAYALGELDSTQCWNYLEQVGAMIKVRFSSWDDYAEKLLKAEHRTRQQEDSGRRYYFGSVSWLKNSAASPWRSISWPTDEATKDFHSPSF